MSNGCSRGNRCHNSIKLLAHLFFHFTPFVEIFDLEVPLLQLRRPLVIGVYFLATEVEQILDVGDYWLARGVDMFEDVLRLLSVTGAQICSATYCSTIARINLADQIDCIVVSVWRPRYHVMPIFFQFADYCLNTPKDGRMW